MYIVTVVRVYNLTKGNVNSNLSTALLSISLGYLLPNPSMKRNGDIVWFLSNLA